MSTLLNTETLKTPIEAVALLLHALHTSTGFLLVEPAPGHDVDVKNRLPSDWAAGGTTKFKYTHEQSGLELLVHVFELGGRGMVAAVSPGVANSSSYSFDFLLTDYFIKDAFPVTFTFGEPSPSDFVTVFNSPTRINDLASLYYQRVLQSIVPGLRMDATSELTASSSGATTSSSRTAGSPLAPSRDGSNNPLAGSLPARETHNSGSASNIGASDLDPLGGRVPQLPGFPGTAGPSFGGIGGGGGGMFVGPEQFASNEGERVWGGDGYLPPGAVPPGARFDPVGPANGPPQPGGVGIGGFGGGSGVGSFGPGGRGGPNAPGGPGGLDPDWDEMRPPGSTGNDFEFSFGRGG
ncbi:hypothetical protein RQP46_004131 [Phenoliferia psychrophenolica]